jgi:hypothetical protein
MHMQILAKKRGAKPLTLEVGIRVVVTVRVYQPE